MTIRSRNKITFFFTILAFVVFLIELFLVLYAVFFKKITFPKVSVTNKSENFLFSYKPIVVTAAILLQSFYSFFVSLCIFKTFHKTQATEIIFFLIFLLAMLCDSIRILIPVFYISQTYSNFLMTVGNVSLFARILSPLSFFGIALLCRDDYRQDLEKNCLIIIVVSLFFSSFIPLNTSVISENFAISYGYIKIVRTYAVIINTLASLTIISHSVKQEFNALMPVGFCITTIGYGIVYTAGSIAFLSAGFLLLCVGTYLYLEQLHRHYLWTD